MADSTSPKGNSNDFAKKVQRQLSRSKAKMLQKLGKAEESRDDQFENYHLMFVDQQSDGNRIYKDLRNYVDKVRDMREASRRLSQSLFDVYEHDWLGEEDLGAIVEGEDLLWNDYEVKLLDQAIRTMESYVSQFPDVKDKIAKRGRKLVDYDSSRHHLEALQAAKKKDDIKINKAEEEVNYAKKVYEGINNELKQELPVLYDSRVGCYVTVFSAMSNLRDIFYKEMRTLNVDLHNVIRELQAQHPDKVFAVRGMQRYGSLRRRTLMSPKAWKASFSDFHRNYSPNTGSRFSFRSPDKPRRSTLSRESSTLAVSPESCGSGSLDLDAESSQSKVHSSPALEENAAAMELRSGEVEEEEEEEEEEVVKEEAAPATEADDKGDGDEDGGSDSSSELNRSCGSESPELQLSDHGPLHIEDEEDTPTSNGLENGEVSGFNPQDPSHKDAPAEKLLSQDPKSTVV